MKKYVLYFAILYVIVALVITIIHGIVVHYNKSDSDQNEKTEQQFIWEDDPPIDFTVKLVHNNIIREKKMQLRASMFNLGNIAETNKQINEVTISMLKNRRAEVNDSIQTEFKKMNLQMADCKEEEIDNVTYFICPIN